MISFICTTVENPNDREFMLWLYQEFKKLMFATARQYVPNPSDCEDIIQDCLVKLIEKISVLRGKSVALYAVTLSILLGTHLSIICGGKK